LRVQAASVCVCTVGWGLGKAWGKGFVGREFAVTACRGPWLAPLRCRPAAVPAAPHAFPCSCHSCARAARAPRSAGVVVLMMDEKLEPAVAKDMIKVLGAARVCGRCVCVCVYVCVGGWGWGWGEGGWGGGGGGARAREGGREGRLMVCAALCGRGWGGQEGGGADFTRTVTFCFTHTIFLRLHRHLHVVFHVVSPGPGPRRAPPTPSTPSSTSSTPCCSTCCGTQYGQYRQYMHAARAAAHRPRRCLRGPLPPPALMRAVRCWVPEPRCSLGPDRTCQPCSRCHCVCYCLLFLPPPPSSPASTFFCFPPPHTHLHTHTLSHRYAGWRAWSRRS
jgi:hypothetical protein